MSCEHSQASLTISNDPGIITVIERFAVDERRKDDAIATAIRYITEAWRQEEAFIGAALLRGRNHPGISCYAQWRRLTDTFSPDAPPRAWSLAAALSEFPPVESRIFSTDFIENLSDPTGTILSFAEAPHLHYGLFSVKPENQNKVMDLGRGNSGKLLGMPGLASINWHRSMDGRMINNFGTWQHFDGLQAMSRQKGFKAGTDDVYWHGWADWDNELFDLAAVITREGLSTAAVARSTSAAVS